MLEQVAPLRALVTTEEWEGVAPIPPSTPAPEWLKAKAYVPPGQQSTPWWERALGIAMLLAALVGVGWVLNAFGAFDDAHERGRCLSYAQVEGRFGEMRSYCEE